MKPIRVFNGGLTGRIYATRSYREVRHGEWVGFTASAKDDVTDQALAAVVDHLHRADEQKHSEDCLCRALSVDDALAAVLLRAKIGAP